MITTDCIGHVLWKTMPKFISHRLWRVNPQTSWGKQNFLNFYRNIDTVRIEVIQRYAIPLGGIRVWFIKRKLCAVLWC